MTVSAPAAAAPLNGVIRARSNQAYNSKKMKSAFATNVKAGRERKGWSQREAAEAAKILNPKMWGSYEEDRAEATFSHLIRICKILDVPITDVGAFINDTGYWTRRKRKKEHEVLKAYGKLKPRDRKLCNVILGLEEQA
ncbi:MAG: XRE family transcriptional regulator [Sphingobacteriales bacterium]|nr:MAG: XRE family transcriptional regulator [Sphingobacteriales bacterium]